MATCNSGVLKRNQEALDVDESDAQKRQDQQFVPIVAKANKTHLQVISGHYKVVEFFLHRTR
jgi:hypothetical protein